MITVDRGETVQMRREYMCRETIEFRKDGVKGIKLIQRHYGPYTVSKRKSLYGVCLVRITYEDRYQLHYL